MSGERNKKFQSSCLVEGQANVFFKAVGMHNAKDSPILFYHIHQPSCWLENCFWLSSKPLGLSYQFWEKQEPSSMQQDGCIAESGLCLAFSTNHSICKKTAGRCAWNASCSSVLGSSLLPLFANFSCDFRKGKIEAWSDDWFQQHYSFLLLWFISLWELIIMQLTESSFMVS